MIVVRLYAPSTLGVESECAHTPDCTRRFMDEMTRRSILQALFQESGEEREGITRRGFLARNHYRASEIEELIGERSIDIREGKYVHLPLLSLDELARSSAEAESVRYLCGHLFDVVRSRFIEAPDERLSEAQLAELADMPPNRVGVALRYLLDAPIWEGWRGSRTGSLTEIIVSETILKYQTLDQAIADMRKMREPRNGRSAGGRNVPEDSEDVMAAAAPGHPYVAASRLEELRSLASTKWDLTRLVRMCEELNTAFENNSYISCLMLVRGILDHVPPIFGRPSFKDVANQYAGGQSFRKSMVYLDQSLRNHADGLLHMRVRRTESLPSMQQIAYWQDLDRLLEELIRILRDEGGAPEQ